MCVEPRCRHQKEAVVKAQEINEDRQPDSDVENALDVGTLSDDTMDGVHEGAASSSSAHTITSAELAKVVEDAQLKIGKLLLNEPDKRYLKMEANQKKLMQELRHDVMKTVGENIDQRLSTAVNEVKNMWEEANKLAAMAQEAVNRATTSEAGRGSTAGSSALPRGPSSGSWTPWTPRTLEIKGYCEWAQRFSQGISSEYSEGYLEKLREELGAGGEPIVWKKSVSANRYAYNYKIVTVMMDFDDLAEARRKVYETKELIALKLREEMFHISQRSCYVVAQAPLGRRELFGHAGRFTAARMKVSPIANLATKREYSGRGITVLAWRQQGSDKNHHLDAAGGRWVGVSEWTTKQKEWGIYEPELQSFEFDHSRLLEALAQEE